MFSPFLVLMSWLFVGFMRAFPLIVIYHMNLLFGLVGWGKVLSQAAQILSARDYDEIHKI
jgi:hypothetical protein